MPSPEPPASATSRRWCELLDGVVSLLPAMTSSILVDGTPASSAAFATRLATVLTERARPIRLTSGARVRDTQPWDIVIWLRTSPGAGPTSDADSDSDRRERREREEHADIVIDLHDQDWPVIRRVTTRLAAGGAW